MLDLFKTKWIFEMKEKWATIIYNPNYMISNFGRVLSTNRNLILKNQRIKNTDYEQVSLYLNGQRQPYAVHRLVAEHFIDNSEVLPEVNHKNGIRHNNVVTNLEWCTRKYNIEDGFKRGRKIWNKGNYVIYDKICPECNTKFQHHEKRRTYCSMKCSNKVNSRKRIILKKKI